jgi:hypothetical protein
MRCLTPAAAVLPLPTAMPHPALSLPQSLARLAWSFAMLGGQWRALAARLADACFACWDCAQPLKADERFLLLWAYARMGRRCRVEPAVLRQFALSFSAGDLGREAPPAGVYALVCAWAWLGIQPG